MSRQYFADVLVDPINANYAGVSTTAETVIVPTAFTPINALEPRGGKIYELLCGGLMTVSTTGTLIISARYGTAVGCTAIVTSPTQTIVGTLTNTPWLLRAYVIFRSIGTTGANSTVICCGGFQAGGAVATAASETSVWFNSAAAVSVDTSVSNAIWFGATFSLVPSLTPFWSAWRSLN